MYLYRTLRFNDNNYFAIYYVHLIIILYFVNVLQKIITQDIAGERFL